MLKPSQLLALLFALGVAAAAAFSLAVQFRSSSHRVLAGRMQEGDVVADDVIARYAGSSLASGQAWTCREDLTRTAILLALAALDRQNLARDYDAWERAMENARATLMTALRCSPFDGNAWLRLAMLDEATAADPKQIADDLDFSAWVAPADVNILANRVSFALIVADRLGTSLSRTAQHDVSTFVRWATVADIAALWRAASVKGRGTIESAATLLPPDRQDELRKAGLFSP